MARSFIRQVTKNLFILSTILICSIFLFTNLIPYLNPQSWWFIGFLGLGVPYIIIALIFAVIFWLIIKPKYALIPLISLGFGYRQIRVAFATNFLPDTKLSVADSTIRIISWNVGSMYGLSNDAEKKKHDRVEIADVIIKLQPDIICLQEFNHSYTKGEEADNIALFLKEYPYYYYAIDFYKNNGAYTTGSIIFSKYPVINSGKKKYPGKYAESLIHADILKQNDTLRIYTTHLQSFAFNSADYKNIDKITGNDKEAISASKNIIQKMKIAFTTRGAQADIVRKELDSCSLLSVLCGDFNDVPNSYTYFHIKGKRQDAFLEKSFGVGKSFIALAPTLRIDYILPDTSFIIQTFDMIDESLSDHLMLVSDISLKK